MFTLQLLGGLSLAGRAEAELGRAAQRKRLALLAILDRAPNHRATRDRLIGLLWPECTEEEARHRLSSALYDLRGALGAAALRSVGDDVLLDPAWLDSDARRFEAAMAAARWDDAVALYAGPFLDGVHLAQAEEFERWVDGERDRLARLAERAAGELRARDSAVRPPQPLEAPAVSRDPVLGALAPRAPDPTGTAPGLERHGRPQRPRLGRASRWASALALTALACAVTWAAARDAGSYADSRVLRVAVFPFRVVGKPDVPDLGTGVVDLLSLTLDGAGELRTVDPNVIMAGLPPARDLGPKAARDRATRLGADRYVLGTVQGSADRLRLRATLHETRTGALEAQATVDGPADRLLELVDQLSASLLSDRLRGGAEVLTRMGAAGTTSLPALKAWLAGEAAFRAGRYDQAAEAFALATDHDSTFALAHYRYSLATIWADRPGASTERHDAEAARFAARLPDHERQLVDAYTAWRAGDAALAEFRYRRLLSRWPDDVEAWQQLGETHFHYNPLRGRPVRESRASFERVLALDPAHAGARWHLALLDALDGRRGAVSETLDALDLTPGTPPAPLEEIRLLRAMLRARPDPVALDLSLQAADETTLWSLAWRFAVFMGDFSAAERAARPLLGPGRNDYERLMGHLALTQLALARGRFEAGLREVRSAPWAGRGFDPQTMIPAILAFWWAPAPAPLLRNALAGVRAREASPVSAYQAGILEIMLGEIAAARSEAARLEFQPGDSLSNRFLATSLRAVLAVRTGRPERALELFDSLGPVGWFGLAVSGDARADPLLRFVRAEALFALGRDDEAFDWYGSLGEHALRDLAYLAPAHFRRGEILERRGRAEEARQEFARVVDLWKGADARLQPWVEAARTRIGILLASGNGRFFPSSVADLPAGGRR